jgi:hypothetical protein
VAAREQNVKKKTPLRVFSTQTVSFLIARMCPLMPEVQAHKILKDEFYAVTRKEKLSVRRIS